MRDLMNKLHPFNVAEALMAVLEDEAFLLVEPVDPHEAVDLSPPTLQLQISLSTTPAQEITLAVGPQLLTALNRETRSNKSGRRRVQQLGRTLMTQLEHDRSTMPDMTVNQLGDAPEQGPDAESCLLRWEDEAIVITLTPVAQSAVA